LNQWFERNGAGESPASFFGNMNYTVR